MTKPLSRWDLHVLSGAALSPLVNAGQVFRPSSDIDWKTLFEFASNAFITPALALALRHSSAPGPDERAYLETILSMNRERNIRLTQKLASTIQALFEAGIETIFLKGMASICDHLYPDFGGRVVSDADILVDESKIADAQRILTNVGFTRSHTEYTHNHNPPDWDKMHHSDPVGDPVSGLWIELHTSVLAKRHSAILNSQEAFEFSVPSQLHGVGVKIMSPEHRLTHAIAHIQLGHQATRDFNHMPQQHLECAMLMAAYPEMLEAVRGRFRKAGFSASFACAVAVCKQLYAVRISQTFSGEHAYIAMLKWATNHPRSANAYRKAVIAPRIVWNQPRKLLMLLTPSGWRKIFPI